MYLCLSIQWINISKWNREKKLLIFGYTLALTIRRAFAILILFFCKFITAYWTGEIIIILQLMNAALIHCLVLSFTRHRQHTDKLGPQFFSVCFFSIRFTCRKLHETWKIRIELNKTNDDREIEKKPLPARWNYCAIFSCSFRNGNKFSLYDIFPIFWNSVRLLSVRLLLLLLPPIRIIMSMANSILTFCLSVYTFRLLCHWKRNDDRMVDCICRFRK